MRHPAIASAVAATLLLPAPAEAASIDRVPNPYGADQVVLSGEIVPDDLARFAAVLKSSMARGKSVSGLQVNSPGGNIGAGYGIALIVRKLGMATSVADHAKCASACFMILAAGVQRRVSKTARIGVHGASEANHADTAQARSATIDSAKIYRSFGVPNAIIGQMVVTPPSEMVWLTHDDLRTMGVSLLDRIEPWQAPATGMVASLPVPAATVSPGSWGALSARAEAMSAAQHGGTVVRSRSCDPSGSCSDAVVYTEADGNPALVRSVAGPDGSVLSRVFCSFNGVVARSCLDVDRGTVTQEVRAADGGWAAAAGE